MLRLICRGKGTDIDSKCHGISLDDVKQGSDKISLNFEKEHSGNGVDDGLSRKQRDFLEAVAAIQVRGRGGGVEG